jgi:hypothetical protein
MRIAQSSLLICKYSSSLAMLTLPLSTMAVLATGTVWAQEYRGSIQGEVRDVTGALVPDARITIRNKATNAERVVGSTERGAYTALNLDAGFYTITIESSGFKTLVRDNVEVRAGEKQGLDFGLEIGQLTERVVVTTAVSGLITDTGSGSTVLNENLSSTLPLTGGNIFALTQTTAGANHGGGAQSHTSERPFDNGGQEGYSINGGAAGGNNNQFLIDGAPNNNNEGLAFVPPQDAVSQVNVITNSYDAEFGKTGGGTVSVSLKSGANAYHGSGNWDFRNNHADARSWGTGSSAVQVTQWSVGTFTLNGPVIIPKVYNGRSRTFASGSYQHFFDKISNTNSRAIPSVSQAVGNFCADAPGNMGIGTIIYDPTSGTPTNRTPFGGCAAGVVGSNLQAYPGRIEPIAAKVAAAMPMANFYANGVLCTNSKASGCGNNYVVPAGRGDHYYSYTFRIDHNISDREKFFGSYEVGNRVEYINNPNNVNAVASDFYPSQTTVRKNHGATLNLTSILSPTLTATSKLNWLRHNGLGRTSSPGISAAALGFSSAYTGLFGADNFPGYTFSNYSTNQGQGGINNTTFSDTWTASETLNKVIGAHSLKAGGGLTVLLQNNANVSLIPSITYTVAFTQKNYLAADGSGDAIASALLGYPAGTGSTTSFSGIGYTNPLPLSYKDTYDFVFVQDDWRVSRNLTLNVGLRWDAQTAPHERYNRTTIGFNPGAASIVAGSNTATGATNGGGGNYLGGLVFATPSARSPYDIVYRNFQPRFGFAYQINHKLVVRGGWGRSFDYAGAYTFAPTTGFTNQTLVPSSTDGSGASPLLCSQVSGCKVPASNPQAGVTANGFASALPNGLIPASGASLGATTGVGNGISFLDPAFRPSHINQFNLALEYQLPFRTVLHGEYNGSRAYELPVSKSIDQVTTAQFLGLNTGLNATKPNPLFGLAPGTGLNTANTTLGQLLKPFPQYADVTKSSSPIGRLWYNALQVKLDKRLSHGLDAYVNFTWSKNLGATSYLNPSYDSPTALTRQLVSMDVPFSTNIGMTWRLPFLTTDHHKFLRATLGGWSISGTAAFHSGVLVGSPSGTSGVVWTGVDPGKNNLSFPTRRRQEFNNSCVINAAGTALLASASCPASATIDTAAWRQTTNSFYLSNIPPYFADNRFAAPPYANATIFKAFQLTERYRAEIRLLGENITNTPYFTTLVSTTPTVTTFGQLSPSQSNDPRSLQLTARISF